MELLCDSKGIGDRPDGSPGGQTCYPYLSIMNFVFRLSLYFMAVLMTVAGIAHLVKPRFYLPIVPEWLPSRMAAIYVSGLVELLAGIGLFIPAYRREAALLVLLLMCIFLPLHAWDCFRFHPAMGSTGRALIRLLLQFVLIGWCWWLLLQTDGQAGAGR